MNTQLFLESIKSDETRHHYDLFLQKWFKFAGEPSEPKEIQDRIIQFILHLKKQGKPYTTIHNYIAPVKAYYQLNDIILNVKKIDKYIPEKKRNRKDRAYEDWEIAKLLQISDERMKVVILLLSSTGCRIGAIPFIKLRHIEDNKLTVYEGSREEYFSFMTSECRRAIDSYIDMRKRYGESINGDSLLIREQFDVRCPSKPKQITLDLLQYKLYDLCKRAGINRKDIAIAHGFRKFFTTQLIQSKVNPEVREMLLGHKIGLASCYYRPTQEEMYSEYEKAIDSLTINEENRLRKKVEVLTMDESRLVRLEKVVQRINRVVSSHQNLLDSV